MTLSEFTDMIVEFKKDNPALENLPIKFYRHRAKKRDQTFEIGGTYPYIRNSASNTDHTSFPYIKIKIQIE